jgi:uncharacterized membrane-anchored protein
MFKKAAKYIEKKELESREKDIESSIHKITTSLMSCNYTHTEQGYIMQEAIKRFLESKRLHKEKLLEEAQEIKDMITKFD